MKSGQPGRDSNRPTGDRLRARGAEIPLPHRANPEQEAKRLGHRFLGKRPARKPQACRVLGRQRKARAERGYDLLAGAKLNRRRRGSGRTLSGPAERPGELREAPFLVHREGL